MGSSAPKADNTPTPFQKKLLERLEKERELADQQAALVTQQSLGQVNLDWLREFGNFNKFRNLVQRGGAAAAPMPFSAINGGFSRPFMNPDGNPRRAV